MRTEKCCQHVGSSISKTETDHVYGKIISFKKEQGEKNLQVSDKRTFKTQQQARDEEGVGPMVTG